MTDDAVLILVWRCNGETVVIPMADSDGNDNVLVRELVAALPESAKGSVEAAALRGVIADQRGVICDLRARLQKQEGDVAAMRIERMQT